MYKIILIAAIMPAIVLLYYIWRRDKYQHEPVRELLKGFGYGALAVFIAGPVEVLLQMVGFSVAEPHTWLGAAWNAFFGVAVVEEGVKLFFLWLLLRKNPLFDEHVDGVVYAVAIGMGFAAVENIGYLFGNLNMWQSVAVSRAVFSVPGHFMFAVAMGYYYSLNHFAHITKADRYKVLLMPVLLHGIFDSLLMMSSVTPQWGGVLWLAFVAFCLTLPGMAKHHINTLLARDREKQDYIRVKSAE